MVYMVYRDQGKVEEASEKEGGIIMSRAEKYNKWAGMILSGLIIAVSFCPIVRLEKAGRQNFIQLFLNPDLPKVPLIYVLIGIQALVPLVYLILFFCWMFQKESFALIILDALTSVVGILGALGVTMASSFLIPEDVDIELWIISGWMVLRVFLGFTELAFRSSRGEFFETLLKEGKR